MVCLAAELLLNSRISDTVLVTLFRTAVETELGEVHKLRRTDGVPTLLLWWWLTVSSVFTDRAAGTTYS